MNQEHIIPFKDIAGNIIQAGDTFVRPQRRSSSCWLEVYRCIEVHNNKVIATNLTTGRKVSLSRMDMNSAKINWNYFSSI